MTDLVLQVLERTTHTSGRGYRSLLSHVPNPMTDSPWRRIGFTWLLGEERMSHSEERGKSLSWALMIPAISNSPEGRDRTGKYGNEAGLTTS